MSGRRREHREGAGGGRRPARRCLGYARVSSQEQALGTSLQDQQAVIEAYAKARGLKVDRFFVEAASAVREKIEHRIEIQALLADVREGDLVLCDKLDRWSRDPEFSYRSIREILEKGASFYAVGDACDPSTTEGDTMLNFRVLFAREEHKRIKQRTVGTRQLLRDQGYYVEGLAPYGYRRSAPPGTRGVQKNVLVIHEAEAAQVRRVFALSAAGHSLAQIGSATGLLKDRVRDILHSRVYTGQLLNSRGEWIVGKHPPIIDAAVFADSFDALQARTHQGPAYRQGVYETDGWMLRDVARCGVCGSRVGAAYAGPHEARRYYYRCLAGCKRYVPVRVVDAAMDPLALARLEELRALLAGDAPAEEKVPARDFAGELADVEAQRRRVLNMYEDGAIDRDEMRRRLISVSEKKLRIEADAARPKRLADPKITRALLGHVNEIRRAWRRATPRTKRLVMTSLAHSVAIVAGDLPRPEWRSVEELAVSVTPGVTYAVPRNADRPLSRRKRGVS